MGSSKEYKHLQISLQYTCFYQDHKTVSSIDVHLPKLHKRVFFIIPVISHMLVIKVIKQRRRITRDGRGILSIAIANIHFKCTERQV